MLTILFIALSFLFPRFALAADWAPLIASTDFDGIRTDVLTVAAGIVSIVLVIIGLAWLVSSFRK